MSLAILALDSGGQPKGWMTPENAVTQYARGGVVWSLGQIIFTFRGGIQRKSGENLRGLEAALSATADRVGKHRRGLNL